MMKEDIYLPKISRMEGLNDLKEILKNDMTKLVSALKSDMTARCDNINIDEDEFRDRLKILYNKSQESSLSLIKSLKKSRKNLFARELLCSLPPRIEFIGDVPPSDMGHVERKLRQFKVEVGNVKEELEALETNVQSQALALIDRFEDNYSAMMNSNVEVFAEFFQKAMNLANRFYDSLKDTAVTAVTQYLEEQGGGNEGGGKGGGEGKGGGGGGKNDNESSAAVNNMLAQVDNNEEEDEEDALEGDNYVALLSNVDTMMEVWGVGGGGVVVCIYRHVAFLSFSLTLFLSSFIYFTTEVIFPPKKKNCIYSKLSLYICLFLYMYIGGKCESRETRISHSKL
jgi:hypothetical protein